MAVHPNCKKVLISNNSAEKEKQASKENGNIESRILIGCAPCIMIPVYTLPAARKRSM